MFHHIKNSCVLCGKVIKLISSVNEVRFSFHKVNKENPNFSGVFYHFYLTLRPSSDASHEPNRMQMRKILQNPLFSLISILQPHSQGLSFSTLRTRLRLLIIYSRDSEKRSQRRLVDLCKFLSVYGMENQSDELINNYTRGLRVNNP